MKIDADLDSVIVIGSMALALVIVVIFIVYGYLRTPPEYEDTRRR